MHILCGICQPFGDATLELLIGHAGTKREGRLKLGQPQFVRPLRVDSVEKLKNETTAKSRGTPVDADFRQCNALWGACGGRSLRIALVMWSPT